MAWFISRWELFKRGYREAAVEQGGEAPDDRQIIFGVLTALGIWGAFAVVFYLW